MKVTSLKALRCLPPYLGGTPQLVGVAASFWQTL